MCAIFGVAILGFLVRERYQVMELCLPPSCLPLSGTHLPSSKKIVSYLLVSSARVCILYISNPESKYATYLRSMCRRRLWSTPLASPFDANHHFWGQDGKHARNTRLEVMNSRPRRPLRYYWSKWTEAFALRVEYDRSIVKKCDVT